MEDIVWTAALETGIAEVDSQHRELVRRMGELQQAVGRKQPAAQVERTLEHLVDYANLHFRTEERLMAQTAYPLLAEHHREHGAFAIQVMKLARRDDPGALGAELLMFLVTWLVAHIQESDQRYVPHLKAAGIS